jgi:hypothetical protein
MTLEIGIRWIVSAGWLVIAVLLERILTLGGITDVSEATQNPPLFLAAGLALIVVAVAITILVAADVRSWPSISMAASAAYVTVGIWLRLENGDDSGAAIALTALLIAVLARGTIGVRRRGTGRSAPPPGA